MTFDRDRFVKMILRRSLGDPALTAQGIGDTYLRVLIRWTDDGHGVIAFHPSLGESMPIPLKPHEKMVAQSLLEAAERREDA